MHLLKSISPAVSGILLYLPLAVAFSWMLTRLCIRFLPQFGYARRPCQRDIHITPVPRGGGLAVIITFFTVNAAFLLGTGINGGEAYFWRFLLPAVPLAILGLFDDRFDLPAWVKLAVHLLVVCIVWFGCQPSYCIWGCQLPRVLSFMVTAVWVILIINAFNLIDGLDGLASGLGFISCACMIVWFFLVGNRAMEIITTAIMAGALLGFLRYNFNPAKIFLGDTGSTFIGLFFAILSLSTLDRVVTFTSILLPLLAIGVPIFDVFLAIWRRSARKLEDNQAHGIMTADQDHLHHRVLRVTNGQKATAFRLYLVGCIFSVIALVILILHNSAPGISYLLLMITIVYVLRQFASIELWDSARLIRKGLSKPRIAFSLHLLQPCYDFVAIATSCLVTSTLLFNRMPDAWLFACSFAPLTLILCLSKSYQVYWLRAGLGNYWRLALTVCLGSWASCLVTWLFCRDVLIQHCPLQNHILLVAAILFTLINLFLIAMERFLLHYAEGYLYRRLFFLFYQQSYDDKLRRVLIYGSGLNCRFYANQLYQSTPEGRREIIVGIIDDNLSLKNLIVHGFPVLGNMENLPEILARHKINKLVLSISKIEPSRLVELENICRKNQLELVSFAMSETKLITVEETNAE